MSDFPQRLGEYLDRLGGLRGQRASEDSIRDAFLRFLRAGFPRLEVAEPFLLEKYVPALRVRGGFADALYGDLIFEFKKRLDDASREDGLDKLGRYLRNQRHPERYFGVLSDGQSLEVYVLQDDKLAKTDGLRLEADSASDAQVWLDCYLFHEKHLTPTANDVALRFGQRSPTFWHSVRVLEALWRQVGSQPAALTKFTEWRSLLSIVYGSQVGDHRLFLCHTYLAVLARVLAFVVLERRSPGPDELPNVLTGEGFRRMGFENFVEDNFFTWIAHPMALEAARSLLHALATRLTAAYDLGAVREDLLKELYQELVDPETRHDLGEFYTPDWLAELTLREAGFPPGRSARTRGGAPDAADIPSMLDPACGSGTFLFTAVRLLREAGYRGKSLVSFCQEHLAGLDVHPLAVTIAKTNVLLALGSDLRAYRGPFALPVYLADSLALADRDTASREVLVPVEVDEISRSSGKEKARGVPEAFGLPAQLASRPETFQAALDALLEFADPKMGAPDASAGFLTRLKQLEVPVSLWHLWEANLDLLRWLLAAPTTDGVWRFILKNAYQPELLSRRKFAYVVGNPPWLSYRYIKRRGYQQRVRELVLAYGLLESRQAHLFTHMELATLFFAFCADRYLAEGGVLAFVMPRSILTGAKQHDAFRQRYVAACRSLIDCEQVMPLFNVPACVAVCTQDAVAGKAEGPPARASIPMVRLSGELPSRNMALAEAREHWQSSETTFSLRQAERESPYWGGHYARGVDRASMRVVRAPAGDRAGNRPASAAIGDRHRHRATGEASVERRSPPRKRRGRVSLRHVAVRPHAAVRLAPASAVGVAASSGERRRGAVARCSGGHSPWPCRARGLVAQGPRNVVAASQNVGRVVAAAELAEHAGAPTFARRREIDLQQEWHAPLCMRRRHNAHAPVAGPRPYGARFHRGLRDVLVRDARGRRGGVPLRRVERAGSRRSDQAASNQGGIWIPARQGRARHPPPAFRSPAHSAIRAYRRPPSAVGAP